MVMFGFTQDTNSGFLKIVTHHSNLTSTPHKSLLRDKTYLTPPGNENGLALWEAKDPVVSEWHSHWALKVRISQHQPAILTIMVVSCKSPKLDGTALNKYYKH